MHHFALVWKWGEVQGSFVYRPSLCWCLGQIIILNLDMFSLSLVEMLGFWCEDTSLSFPLWIKVDREELKIEYPFDLKMSNRYVLDFGIHVYWIHTYIIICIYIHMIYDICFTMLLVNISDTRREPAKVNRCALLRPTVRLEAEWENKIPRREWSCPFEFVVFYLHKFGFLLYFIFLSFDVAMISWFPFFW